MAASRITLVVIFVATWTECPFSRSAIAQKQKSDSAKSTPLADAEIIEKCGKLESLVQALVNKVRNANEECEKHIQNMQKAQRQLDAAQKIDRPALTEDVERFQEMAAMARLDSIPLEEELSVMKKMLRELKIKSRAQSEKRRLGQIQRTKLAEIKTLEEQIKAKRDAIVEKGVRITIDQWFEKENAFLGIDDGPTTVEAKPAPSERPKEASMLPQGFEREKGEARRRRYDSAKQTQDQLVIERKELQQLWQRLATAQDAMIDIDAGLEFAQIQLEQIEESPFAQRATPSQLKQIRTIEKQLESSQSQNPRRKEELRGTGKTAK